MTSVSVNLSVDANDELWSINGQFDVTKTVIKGRSGLPSEDKRENLLQNRQFCSSTQFISLISPNLFLIGNSDE